MYNLSDPRFVAKGKPETCGKCPLVTTGVGFCPDSSSRGDAFNLQDYEFVALAQSPGAHEIENGYPLCGPSGFVIDNWVVPRVYDYPVKYGKSNVLRCHPAKNKYPTGKVRFGAEAACRMYDGFNLDTDFDFVVVTLHPSNVMLAEYDTLPLIVRDFERMKSLPGRKLILMGTEALEQFAPHLKEVGGGVKDWRGHYWSTKGDERYVPNQSCIQLINTLPKPEPGPLSIDLEWDPKYNITSFAASTNSQTYVAPFWSEAHKYWLKQAMDAAECIVGFNLLGHNSDLDVLDKNGLSGRSYSAKVDDVMLMFHLACPQLAGKGLLDLWTCVSMFDDVANWKLCRGSKCIGACPLHDKLGYNALDASKVLAVWNKIRRYVI